MIVGWLTYMVLLEELMRETGVNSARTWYIDG